MTQLLLVSICVTSLNIPERLIDWLVNETVTSIHRFCLHQEDIWKHLIFKAKLSGFFRPDTKDVAYVNGSNLLYLRDGAVPRVVHVTRSFRWKSYPLIEARFLKNQTYSLYPRCFGRSEESELDSSEYCKQQYWRKPENVPGFIFSREGRLPAVKPAILFICQKVLLASGFSSENRIWGLVDNH